MTQPIPPRGLAARIWFNLRWTMAAEAIAKAFMFAAGILLARNLGPVGFGRYFFAWSVIQIAWLFVDLGTGLYGTREVARYPERVAALLGEFLFIRVSLSLVVSCTLLVTVWGLMARRPQLDPLTLFVLYLLISSLNLDWALRGVERADILAWGNATGGLVFLGMACLIATGPKGPEWGVVARVTGAAAGALVCWVGMRPHVVWGDVLSSRVGIIIARLRTSATFAVSALLMTLYLNVPTYVVAGFKGDKGLGSFAAAYSLGLSLSMGAFVVSVALYPVLASLHRNSKEQFVILQRSLLRFLLLGALPLAALITLEHHALTLLLFGQEFAQSSIYVGVLIWLVPLFGIRCAFGGALLAADLQWAQALGSGAGLAASVAGSVVSMQWFGVLGVCISILATESCVVSILAGVYLGRIGGRSELIQLAVRFLSVGGALFVGIPLLLRVPSELVRIGALLSGYIVLVVGTGLLRVSDLRFASAMLLRQRAGVKVSQ